VVQEVEGEWSTESARAFDRKFVVAGQLQSPLEQSGVANCRVLEFRCSLLTTDVVHRAGSKRLLVTINSDHHGLLLGTREVGRAMRNQRSG
jgi:hypothetical protein